MYNLGSIIASTDDPKTFERPIARLGCGIHQNLPSFRSVTHSTYNRSVARSLGYDDPRITQSQLIVKLAGVGGRIIPHQDGCVSFTNPPSSLTFWYALEDATPENGCLCIAAGSHLTEPLRQRLIVGPGGRATFENLKEPLRADGVHHQETTAAQTEYEYTPLEAKKGTLILFHGNLMHKSEANRSSRDRIAYMFSIVEGGLKCPDNLYMKPTVGEYDSL